MSTHTNSQLASDASHDTSRDAAGGCCVEDGNFTDATHLENWNRSLENLTAQGRVQCALEHLPGRHVLTSSFGAQSAVSLHLLTRELPDIPVVLLDTGYLFEETYQFIDQLTERLDLNLEIYRSRMSPAWQEARFGQRWTQGPEGLEQYNFDNKVEPMQRAMSELQVGTWFSGLRRDQSSSRTDTPFVQHLNGYFKVCPIADWSDRDVYGYLKENDLPYHPLWDKGYVSIGDAHTSRPISAEMNEQDTRFFGLLRECGLHEVENFQEASVS